jgi:hypothetical protein
VARIFARWAIATFANICIETQDGAGHRLVPRDESVKRGGELVCFATEQSSVGPQRRCFHVFLTKWCEEPVTVGSRGPQ